MNKETYTREIEHLGVEAAAGFRNSIAIRDYSTTTRKLVREQEELLEVFQKQINQQNKQIQNLQDQIRALQIKILQIDNITG